MRTRHWGLVWLLMLALSSMIWVLVIWFLSTSLAAAGWTGPAKDIEAGILATTLGDFDQAISVYNKIIRSEDTDDLHLAWAHYTRGIAWYKKGDFDRAIADCTASLKIFPGCPGPRIVRGNAWNKKGYFDRAITDYTCALKTPVPNKNVSMIYHNRGVVLEKKGDLWRALADAEKAFSLRPGSEIFRDRVADLKSKLKSMK
ncbi:MAG: tetratricopeptide repeat protein [Deltaproteobacteria bacterium]|nr:tetratricopeptide repeat protein [Deltaproteobacteria bacterium]